MILLYSKERCLIIIANSSQKQQHTRSNSYQIEQYLTNDEPVPDGEIDPTHLVPAQTNNSDSLTPTVSGIGMKSDHIPHIPIPPLLTTHRVLQAKLDELESALKDFRTQKNQLSETDEQQKQFLTDAIARYTPYVAEAKHTLNRVRTLYMSAATIPSILHFQPGLVAYQLTHIESAIFLAIPSHALLTHTAKTPHPRVVASSDFFNYVTRLIEHSILLPQEASARAQHINHWIKVASKCQDLNNYQTLKAIVSALGTPPVQRLKRTWAYIPKKSLSRLESMNELMSETNNYGKYREHMGIVSTSVLNGKSVHLIQSEHYKRPTVPFLGTFIHDMTYLLAAVQQQKGNNNSSNTIVTDNGVPSIPLRTSSRKYNTSDDFHQDPRISKLLETLQNFQSTPPYDRRPSTKMITSKTQNQVRPALSQAIHRSKSSFGRLGGAIGFGNTATAAASDNSSDTMPNYTQDCSTEDFDTEEQQSLVTQYILMRSWVSQNTVDELSLLREPPTNQGKHTGRTSSITSSMMSNTSSLMRLSNHSPATSSTFTLASSMDSSSRPASMDDDLHGRSYVYGRCSALTAPLTSSSTLDDDDDYQHTTILSRDGITSSTKFWNDPVINLYNKGKLLYGILFQNVSILMFDKSFRQFSSYCTSSTFSTYVIQVCTVSKNCT